MGSDTRASRATRPAALLGRKRYSPKSSGLTVSRKRVNLDVVLGLGLGVDDARLEHGVVHPDGGARAGGEGDRVGGLASITSRRSPSRGYLGVEGALLEAGDLDLGRPGAEALGIERMRSCAAGAASRPSIATRIEVASCAPIQIGSTSAGGLGGCSRMTCWPAESSATPATRTRSCGHPFGAVVPPAS